MGQPLCFALPAFYKLTSSDIALTDDLECFSEHSAFPNTNLLAVWFGSQFTIVLLKRIWLSLSCGKKCSTLVNIDSNFKSSLANLLLYPRRQTYLLPSRIMPLHPQRLLFLGHALHLCPTSPQTCLESRSAHIAEHAGCTLFLPAFSWHRNC